MPHETSMPPNVIDTSQIFDGAITLSKFGADTTAAMQAIVAQLALAQNILATSTVAYTDTKKTVAVLPVGTLVTGVILYVKTTFNGSGATVSVGNDSNSNSQLLNAVSPLTHGYVYGNDPATDCGGGLWTAGAQNGSTPFAVTAWGRRITTWIDPSYDSTINAYVTPGTGATAGAATIILYGVPAPAGVTFA